MTSISLNQVYMRTSNNVLCIVSNIEGDQITLVSLTPMDYAWNGPRDHVLLDFILVSNLSKLEKIIYNIL